MVVAGGLEQVNVDGSKNDGSNCGSDQTLFLFYILFFYFFVIFAMLTWT